MLKAERSHQSNQISAVHTTLEQTRIEYEKIRGHEHSLIMTELAALKAHYEQKIAEYEEKVSAKAAEYEKKIVANATEYKKRIAVNDTSEKELVDHVFHLEWENQRLCDQGNSLVGQPSLCFSEASWFPSLQEGQLAEAKQAICSATERQEWEYMIQYLFNQMS